MTVSEYCRHETGVRELVIIRKGGWTCCAAYIDHEDLLRIPTPSRPLTTFGSLTLTSVS